MNIFDLIDELGRPIILENSLMKIIEYFILILGKSFQVGPTNKNRCQSFTDMALNSYRNILLNKVFQHSVMI